MLYTSLSLDWALCSWYKQLSVINTGAVDYGWFYSECEYGGCNYGGCEYGECEYGGCDYGGCVSVGL